MRRSNFALRLQPSLLEELRKAEELECGTPNQIEPCRRKTDIGRGRGSCA